MPKPTPLHVKRALVADARKRLAAGESLSAIAVDLGKPKGTLHKWLNAPDLAADYSRCGRPAKFRLEEEEANALRALCLKHGSFAVGVELFPLDPDCTEETRALIQEEIERAAEQRRRVRWPEKLRAQILSRAEEEALFRGAKAFDAISHAPRKGMFYEDSSGQEIPIGPLDVWGMDDYSTNQPYIVETEDGPRLCRQYFATSDYYSSGWLSVESIGRERDAYRAEDITRYILRTIEAQGTMPLVLILERGRWESKAVHGIDLGKELGIEGLRGQRWGGLDALFHIEHGYSPRHKAWLESSFNLLQTFLSHSGRDIGRVRGEFEYSTKLALAVAAGRKDPYACGFLTQDESANAHVAAMHHMNTRGRQRSASEFGGQVLTPNDLLHHPRSEKRPLPDSELWRFAPVKRKATVSKGFIQVQVDHYGAPFRFEANGVSERYLEHGHKVLIAFDPAMPELGAHVANGTVNCREGWGIGEAIMQAPHAKDAPAFSLRTRRPGERSNKAKAASAARTAFAGINPHKKGMTHTQAHGSDQGTRVTRTGKPMKTTTGPGRQPDTRGTRTTGLTGTRGTRTTTPEPDRNSSAAEVAARRRAALAELED